MSIFPIVLFLILAVLFVGSSFLMYRGIRRRQKQRVWLLAVPLLALAFYFAHVAFGPFFQRSPQRIFEYAVGFPAPDGCVNLVGYEEQGFNPGVTIWLRCNVSSEVLAKIVANGRFTTSSSQVFSDLQKHQATVDWWTPITQPPGIYWESGEFHGPYAFHTAGIAYDPKSQTAFLYVNGFE